MKEYTYQKRMFFIEVTITGIFCCFLCIATIIMAFLQIMPALMLLLAGVCLYTVWNSFVSKSNTETVEIADDYISFHAYHRKDVYNIVDIKNIRIREFPSSGKMYIRMNKTTLFHGRYWLQTKMFNDGNELFHALLDLEYKLHPDTLKARARRVNTQYMEAEKKQRMKQKRKIRFHK